MKRTLRTLLLMVLCGLSVSCRDAPSISSSNPDRLVPAIKIAVRTGDRSAIPFMVRDLESDDSAVRMYAIDGLHRLTGQDFGYVYFADDSLRKPAVERWQRWLAQQAHSQAASTTSSAE
jgi:hypothetical protein